MFHIKICGVQRACDIDAVAHSCADAIGLNFFHRSVRYVNPSAPSTLALSRQAAAAGLIRVGVFVNESVDGIFDVAKQLGLDHVQLHGDEQLEVARDLVSRGLSVIRAIKIPTASSGGYPIAGQMTKWLDAGCILLLDADAGADHGGSGHTLDWRSIRHWSDEHPDIHWVLAGGLSIDNVAQAISTSRARAVDVASGVEQPRGTKSAQLIERFARLASESFP